MLKRVKFYVRKYIKNIFGENIFIKYHYCLAILASNIYGNPSKKMYVVAVTGTKGKTSTLNFMWHVLTAGGHKVGLISTANIKIGTEEKMNWYHMTMPGRFLLQKLLREMSDAGCDIVLVEATSEGIKMARHVGLYYDVAVFTNIFPEHLKSHGNSFEEYRNTKGILFSNLIKLPKKILPNPPLKGGNSDEVQKIMIVNSEDIEGKYFLSFPADKKYEFGEREVEEFEKKYKISLLGRFNIYNALPAVILAKHLGMSEEQIQEGLKNCEIIPGRMEIIVAGQNFTAIVDYAHEGVSMRLALEAARGALKIKDGPNKNKLIAVYGAEGGGREMSKRETMSKAVTELADIAIVTLSDPFDVDPEEINADIVKWLEKFGWQSTGVNKNIFDYIDRREAIEKAVELAKEGDVILFASKGAEQSIVFKDHVEPWDDRVEVKNAIKKRLEA